MITQISLIMPHAGEGTFEPWKSGLPLSRWRERVLVKVHIYYRCNHSFESV